MKIRGRLSESKLRQSVESGEIDTVVTVFPDMYGRLMGKRIDAEFFIEETLPHGMHCCDYLLACDMEMDPVQGYAFTSWADGYGDFNARPDLSTLRCAAWLEKSAIVLCDLFSESGSPVEISPRRILKRQLERAAVKGLTVMAASELEFFILKDSYEELEAKNFDDLRTEGWYVEDYHTLHSLREEPLVGEIRRAMRHSAIPVEFSKGEWGPGQHEINLNYDEMLEMADRHCVYKQAAKEIAILQGRAVSFMAKMHEDLAGNSMHVHSSLWHRDSGESAFAGDEALPGVEERGSKLLRWYLGGLLEHARESALFFAPNVNSYKRYVAGSFAPTAVAWAYDNRTTGFRMVGDGSSLRVESRIPGGDANPYLAMAAILAAGLDGIDNEIEPPSAFSGDAYIAEDLACVPSSLEEARQLFADSDFLKRSFGAEVIEHYLHFSRIELDKFQRAVTTWERRRFLERG